jgi:hypothetical protein
LDKGNGEKTLPCLSPGFSRLPFSSLSLCPLRPLW